MYRRLDALLQRKGFASLQVRKVAATAIILSTSLLALGLLAVPFAKWPLWMGVGAVLGAWNFLSLAYGIQLIFRNNRQKTNLSGKIMIAQLFGTNLRLFITGILIYVSVVRFNASVFPLTAGLFFTVLSIPVVALSGNSRPEDRADSQRETSRRP